MHTLVVDIGKTNKKALVFDAELRVVAEASERLPETRDEDGDPCEDLAALERWVDARVAELRAAWPVGRVNFTTYGASLVYVDAADRPLTPLYDYLKPIDTDGLRRDIYRAHGGPQHLHAVTASPPLEGGLNSGFQLAWLRARRPGAFAKTRYALHLPNYLSYRYSGCVVADYTSIGCHTALWDFPRGAYHAWVAESGLAGVLPPARAATGVAPGRGPAEGLLVGTGIHDSSAALLPHLRDRERAAAGGHGAGGGFVLLSTGTWSIAFNPDNHSPLTTYELSRDCLAFMQPDGRPVKASRLFLGREHELQVERLAARFGVSPNAYRDLAYDAALDPVGQPPVTRWVVLPQRVEPAGEAPADADFARAYHRLMRELVDAQAGQLRLIVADGELRELVVDGGFAANALFLAMLARTYPGARVRTGTHAQGTALGAAIALQPRATQAETPAA